jgi:hypothetical protein
MNLNRCAAQVLAIAAMLLMQHQGHARPPEAASRLVTRDGAGDFQFDIGKWRTHSSRLLHPLTGARDWVAMDGYTIVRPIWDGRANLAEFAADGPAGHLELIALRTYNPGAHQWSIYFASPGSGKLATPSIGAFQRGRGAFYDHERVNGQSVWVRFMIWGITPDAAQSEQAFSADGGKTWETNWVNHYTRVRDDGAA